MNKPQSGLIMPGYVMEMAAHNAWQNGVVFGLVDPLDDEERRRDRGMFFGSIHHTLDHIVAVDGWILDTLDGVPPQSFDMKDIQSPDWEELKAARSELDARIEALAARTDQGWLDGILEIESESLGRVRRIPRGLYVVQMFSHQTHHRSQVTAELWRLGIDYGSTDIPFRPDSPY